MKFVIDTNILLSALIKDSITREILATAGWSFYYPEIAFHEVRKYKALVLKKSGVREQEYNELLNDLVTCIVLISEEQIKQYLEEANKLICHRDKNDVVFLATALSIDNCMIWSNDKDFFGQDKVITLKTKDIIGMIKTFSKK